MIYIQNTVLRIYDQSYGEMIFLNDKNNGELVVPRSKPTYNFIYDLVISNFTYKIAIEGNDMSEFERTGLTFWIKNFEGKYHNFMLYY
jgi:hypothetical protein